MKIYLNAQEQHHVVVGLNMLRDHVESLEGIHNIMEEGFPQKYRDVLDCTGLLSADDIDTLCTRIILHAPDQESVPRPKQRGLWKDLAVFLFVSVVLGYSLWDGLSRERKSITNPTPAQVEELLAPIQSSQLDKIGVQHLDERDYMIVARFRKSQ